MTVSEKHDRKRDQQLSALAFGNARRVAVSECRAHIRGLRRRDAINVVATMLREENTPHLEAMKVSRLLLSVSGVGPVVADRCLRRAGMTVDRRLREMTGGQRHRLAAVLESSCWENSSWMT